MFGDDRLFENLVKEGEGIENDSDKNVDEVVDKHIPEGGSVDYHGRTGVVKGYDNGAYIVYFSDVDKEEEIDEIELWDQDPAAFESKVKEAQAPFTKQEIEFTIGELQDKIGEASVDDFRDADSYQFAIAEWTDEIEKLEASLADAPSEAEVEAETVSSDPEPDREASAERGAEDVHPELSPSSKERYVDDAYDEGNTKRDLLDIANTRLGWAVAEQLKTILDNPTKEGIEDGELNSNAVKLIYDFLRSKPDRLSLEAKAAIEDWVEEGWGDPDVLESKTDEEETEETEEKRTDTVSNDPSFERTVEKFSEAVRGELPHYDYDTDDKELDRIYTMAEELYVGASDEDKDYLQKVMDEIMLFSNQHERDAELEAAEETDESKVDEEELTSEVDCKGCGEKFDATGEEEYCSDVCRERDEAKESKIKEGVQEDYDAELGSLVARVSEFVGEDVSQEQIQMVIHNLVLSGGASDLKDLVRAYGNVRAELDFPSEERAEESMEGINEDISDDIVANILSALGDRKEITATDVTNEYIYAYTDEVLSRIYKEVVSKLEQQDIQVLREDKTNG